MPRANRRLPVRFTPRAFEDIDVAFAFVSDRNRTAARKLLGHLQIATDRLATFPEMGAPLPAEGFEFVTPGIRFTLVEPYIVFYRATGDEVRILRILHSHQDSLGALFE